MPRNATTQVFDKARPKLLGLAYRILGSLADAEDAIQDTYIKWSTADHSNIDNPPAWLSTVCTRHCLDMLKAAHRDRVSYIGTWLPEPVQTATDNDETTLALATSLTTAFLLMLERLTPKERAAYLLHEIFETPYQDIAHTLEIKESACRKLVSRAKSNIDQAKVRHATPAAKQDQLLKAFETAITLGDTSQLSHLLSEDIQLSADGGGKVPTIRETLEGKDSVLTFLTKQLHRFWADQQWINTDINGSRGILIKERNTLTAVVSFAYDHNDKVTDIFIVRNPEKINHLDTTNIH